MQITILVTDVQLAVRIGVIGLRNHAERLKIILEGRDDCQVCFLYHPSKKIDDIRSTNDISDIYEMDAVFITSPNDTHVKYIELLLKNSNAYIFCEKPPATNEIELKILQDMTDNDRKRIFFNFNFRFSQLNEIIETQLATNEIGKIINIVIIASQGLAFKDNYVESWRADGEKNLHNIIETVSIHYLDLLNFHFIIKEIIYRPSLVSGKGTSFDTSHLFITYQNGVTATIFNSYATPYVNEVFIIGTNGYCLLENDNLQIRYPRDTFDSKGFFITPSKSVNCEFNMKKNYEQSLKNSIDYFVRCIKNKTNIDIKYYDISIKTNQQILDLKKNHN